jgi:outer membrane protein TolC
LRIEQVQNMQDHGLTSRIASLRKVARILGLLAVLSSGCVGTNERAARDGLREHVDGDPWGPTPTQVRGAREAEDGLPAGEHSDDPAAYVAMALENHPALEADFNRWRSGVLRISRSRRLPDPEVTYALFVRQVETRVGPQRQRLSVTQAFPWPTQLSTGAEAAAFRAQALGRRFDSRVLQVRAAVEEMYWRLWYIRQAQDVLAEQLVVFDQMAATVRARLESGSAAFADLLQVDVSRARLRDAIDALHEHERAAQAGLLQSVGAAPGTPTPTTTQHPVVVLPSESDDALREAVARHPDLAFFEQMAAAQEAEARRSAAEGLPTLMVGLDWIETGPAVGPVNGSGRDAVVLRVGASVPLQRRSYRDARDAASAEADAFRGDQRAARDVAFAQLEAAMSAVRDTHRRVLLHRNTLIPQAEAAYEAVLGAYESGRGSVAANLLAQRDLLDLADALVEAEAMHARAWARLESVVGRQVSRVAAQDTSDVDE